MKEVIVVTSTELGWDCVVGVYSSMQKAVELLTEEHEEADTMTYEEKLSWLEKDCYVLHEEVVDY